MLLDNDTLIGGLPDDTWVVTYEDSVSSRFPSKRGYADIDPLMLGALALDLVQHVNDEASILREYRIAPEELVRLKNTALFQRELENAREAVKTDGGLAAFRMRCRMAAEQILPHLANPANLAGAKMSEMVSAFKALSEIGDIAPKQANNNGGGATIIFQLPDLPGLPKNLTIDGTAQRVVEAVPLSAAA